MKGRAEGKDRKTDPNQKPTSEAAVAREEDESEEEDWDDYALDREDREAHGDRMKAQRLASKLSQQIGGQSTAKAPKQYQHLLMDLDEPGKLPGSGEKPMKKHTSYMKYCRRKTNKGHKKR